MMETVFGRKHERRRKCWLHFCPSSQCFYMLLSLDHQNPGLCSKGLTFSLLMTTQEALVDSADQDQTAHSVQSYL